MPLSQCPEDQYLEKQKSKLLKKLSRITQTEESRTPNIQVASQKEMVWIKFALKRIESGEYGLCTNCGLPIDRNFLEALPESPWCPSCREKLVSTH